jgi:hypothetical protein
MLFRPGSVVPLWLFLVLIIPATTYALYLRYYNLKRRYLLALEAQPTQWRDALTRILLARPFIPPYYTAIEYHGQIQTIVQSLFRRLSYYFSKSRRGTGGGRIEYSREEFQLSDGGLMALDWAYRLAENGEKEFNDKSDSLIIIQHGLGGSSKSGTLPPLSLCLSLTHSLSLWQSTLFISLSVFTPPPIKWSLWSPEAVAGSRSKLQLSFLERRATFARSSPTYTTRPPPTPGLVCVPEEAVAEMRRKSLLGSCSSLASLSEPLSVSNTSTRRALSLP